MKSSEVIPTTKDGNLSQGRAISSAEIIRECSTQRAWKTTTSTINSRESEWTKFRAMIITRINRAVIRPFEACLIENLLSNFLGESVPRRRHMIRIGRSLMSLPDPLRMISKSAAIVLMILMILHMMVVVLLMLVVVLNRHMKRRTGTGIHRDHAVSRGHRKSRRGEIGTRRRPRDELGRLSVEAAEGRVPRKGGGIGGSREIAGRQI